MTVFLDRATATRAKMMAGRARFRMVLVTKTVPVGVGAEVRQIETDRSTADREGEEYVYATKTQDD